MTTEKKHCPPSGNLTAAFIDVSAMTEWRRDFHAHPETAYEEVRTAEKVNDLLRSWGIETHVNIGKTGVVGVLKGGNAGPGSPSVGLRADMDALPVTSDTAALPYTSKIPGKAHACGHDGHTAMLLGAAKYLSETKNFSGTVYFIFQPAEEVGAGARAMIEDGLFNIVRCDSIYGMHTSPYTNIRVGQIGVDEGVITANSDTFSIGITGRGGHAASSADNIDIISLASEIVIELRRYREEEDPSGKEAVLAVTMFHGGEAPNAMPEKVALGGTVRAFSPDMRDKIEKAVRDIPERLAAAYSAKVSVEYKRGCSSVCNSREQTAHARAVATALLGAGNVVKTGRGMYGEDFSCFTERVPGAYIVLGQWDGKSPQNKLHSPGFDFNDATLETGASYWVRLVESLMPAASPAPGRKTPHEKGAATGLTPS
ncbi:MAG: amidohydrolase [Pseudomonadota bacterium]